MDDVLQELTWSHWGTQEQVTLLLLIFYCIVFGAVLHDFVVDVVEQVTSLFFGVVVHHKS